jgi:hypothetical protein
VNDPAVRVRDLSPANLAFAHPHPPPNIGAGRRFGRDYPIGRVEHSGVCPVAVRDKRAHLVPAAEPGHDPDARGHVKRDGQATEENVVVWHTVSIRSAER